MLTRDHLKYGGLIVLDGRTICPHNPIHDRREVVEEGLTLKKRIQGATTSSVGVLIDIAAVKYRRDDGGEVIVAVDGYTAKMV